jgi:hypothetical protein
MLKRSVRFIEVHCGVFVHARSFSEHPDSVEPWSPGSPLFLMPADCTDAESDAPLASSLTDILTRTAPDDLPERI